MRILINLSHQNPRAYLSNCLHNSYKFGTLADTANLRIPLFHPETGQKLDNYFDRYENVLGAYLYKRKVNKSEIAPKIHIIDELPESEAKHIQYQALVPLKSGIDEKMMEKMVKEDPSTINSSYIISIFCEDHFKDLIDEYVTKVMVCGKAPKSEIEEKVNQIEQKSIDLFKTFYYGEQITALQREIELKYLTRKQNKFFNFHHELYQGQKNEYFRCVWTETNQRIVEDLANWVSRDYNNSDITFRPFYEPLNLQNRLEPVEKMHSLMEGKGILEQYKFNRDIKPYYTLSNKHFLFMSKKIYTRIAKWLDSVEFTNLLKIPPDFVVEMAIYVVHVWLITNRLKQINTKNSRYLSKIISDLFDKIVNAKTAELNVKKEGALLKQLHKMFTMNEKMLKYHFIQSERTRQNPYVGIDALIWSIVFGQKIERYEDVVYLFSQYVVKNYQMLKHYSEEEIMNGIFEFDAYYIDPNYRAIIEEVNPPLSRAEYEAEMDSDTKYKKYSYSFVQSKDQNYELYEKSLPDLSYSWKEMIINPIKRVVRKYTNMAAMDHFNEMERQEKEQIQKEKNTLWKSDRDQIKEVEDEYKKVKEVRRGISKRKNWSNFK